MRSKIMPINLPMTNNKSKPSDTGCSAGTDKKYWSIAQARGKSSLMLVHFDIPWSQSINKSFLLSFLVILSLGLKIEQS